MPLYPIPTWTISSALTDCCVFLWAAEKHLSLYGPPGFLKNVEGKLAAYTWNLADKYNYPLSLQINEVHPQYTIGRQYRCRDRFQPIGDPVEQPFAGILYEAPAFRVSAVILDHKIPCLGFSIGNVFMSTSSKTA